MLNFLLYGKSRFYNAVDLINLLIKEQTEQHQGSLIRRLLQQVDSVMETGC